jgi:hypothetical protein
MAIIVMPGWAYQPRSLVLRLFAPCRATISAKVKQLALALPLVFAGSAAAYAEWTVSPFPSSDNPNVGASIQHDGAELIVWCDVEARHEWIAFREPRANWKNGEEIPVGTAIDEGSQQESPSPGTVVEATMVMIDHLQHLLLMGRAKTSVTVVAGGYRRTFPTANLRKAVEPILHWCQDRWPEPEEATMETMKFLLLVTWIAHNQPPSNYQVPFSTGQACELARLQVLKDADRMRKERLESATANDRGGVLAMNAVTTAPSVSAVCVAQ